VKPMTSAEIVQKAALARKAVPGFNIPYLPMMAPVVHALRDTNSFGFIMVARLEWRKFEARSLEAIREEYEKHCHPDHVRLHLDHVPVVDEDDEHVDVMAIMRRALQCGYDSLMIDGSRLPLDDNIRHTREVVDAAHAMNVPVEAELGAVLGHETGPLPPYEELFKSGQGFTDPHDAARFVQETGTDWLSVAIGNVHGAISAATKDKAKIRARLDIQHLAKIQNATGIPLVLHGGTGIPASILRDSLGHGIAKINIATAIRQPYEAALKTSEQDPQQAVYDTMTSIIRQDLALSDTATLYNGKET